jgi:hypothetical protein
VAPSAGQDPIFQRYQQVLAVNRATQRHTHPSSLEEILKDCQKRLRVMALIFNLESPRNFNRDALQLFEKDFLKNIHAIASDPTKPDKRVSPYIGSRNMVENCLDQASLSLSTARRALARIKSPKDAKLEFYKALNDCTSHFEVALKNWGPVEPNKNLWPPLKEIIPSDCFEKLRKMNRYFVETAFSDIRKASVREYEEELREEIILVALDASAKDIFQKIVVITMLRKAKIYLNLALDEFEQKPQTKTSEARLDKYLEQCKVSFRGAIKQWKDHEAASKLEYMRGDP